MNQNLDNANNEINNNVEIVDENVGHDVFSNDAVNIIDEDVDNVTEGESGKKSMIFVIILLVLIGAFIFFLPIISDFLSNYL